MHQKKTTPGANDAPVDLSDLALAMDLAICEVSGLEQPIEKMSNQGSLCLLLIFETTLLGT